MNIKILQKKEEVRFDKPHGEPDLAECWWTKGNYITTRLVEGDEIVWFGHAVNWKRVDGAWYKLEGTDFVPCDEPIYETLYKNINK
tara:strand:- start:1961 stop:2218 length:258 start_codon:yes stop_codon:yes gene_type:complete